MSDKRPSLQWYTGDWLKDPAVGQLTPMARGIWVDMLCLMHENNRSGEIEGTVESLSRICRCSPVEMEAVLSEFTVTKCADVTVCHKNIHVRNRRMHREHRERISNKNRQQRYRNKQQDGEDEKNNKNITAHSSSSSSTSVKKETKKGGSNGPEKQEIKPADMTNINTQAWEDFVQHRKNIRKPLVSADGSTLARDKALNVLRSMMPEEQQQSVDNTIQNGWTGVFPPKGGASLPLKKNETQRLLETLGGRNGRLT